MTTILSSCVVGDLEIATGDGTDVEAGAISLVNDPLWMVSNLGMLWVRGEVRGSDVLMPGADGVRPFRRRPTVTAYSLPFVISGDVDYETGEACSSDDDRWVAFERNLAYIDDNLVAPPGTREGTREARMTMPSGAERWADLHVLRLTGRVEDATFVGVMNISIPAGRLAEAVS